MVNFTRLTALSLLAVSMFGSNDVFAARPLVKFDLHKFAYKGSTVREQAKYRNLLEGTVSYDPTRAEKPVILAENNDGNMPQPDFSLPANEVVGDIDAPDGSLWFYTGNFKYDYIKESEYYTQAIMREYEFKIYDSEFNLVGTIKDKVNYKENETRVPQADIAPVVTRNFFNSDDNYEVVVGLVVNTVQYINNEYSIVYSLGGEKEDGYDKPVMTIQALIGDVLNASTPDEERYFITFMRDDNAEVNEKDPDTADPDDPDKLGYWEMLTSYGITTETYAQAGSDGKLVKVWENRLRLADLPGDQQSSAFFFSFVKNDVPYFVVSKYADTFFNPYYDFMEETTQRENNKLIVDLYTVKDGKFDLVKNTEIPAPLDTENERTLCTYYSVGSLRYQDDVIFSSDPSQVEYIVTTQDYSKENDDSYISSYYIYKGDGTVKATLFKKSLSHSTLADLDGFDAAEVFVTTNMVGDYVFHIVNLRTGEEELSFTNKYEISDDIDPEMITSNLDRVPKGDTYMYAIELRSPGQDEYGNDVMRVMWINRDGSFDRIDEIPMGTGVYYATVMIESRSLNAHLYDADDEIEYLVLVKRGYENGKVMEEVLVSKPMSEAYPDGKILLTLLPDEERGVLRNIAPYTYTDSPMLIITYYNDETDRYHDDFYRLPFGSGDSGVGMIGGDADGVAAISFDGAHLVADGMISVYNMQGVKVAEGKDKVTVASLTAGMYVATANGKSVKILVK